MSFEPWLDLIKRAEKTSIISGKLRKIHYTFPDGKEMVEEYSLETGCVLRRAWKKSKNLTSSSTDFEWDIELGEVSIKPKLNEKLDEIIDDSFFVRESNTEPILSKRITKRNIEWRIRNLPYPIETYQVTADKEKKCIIIRTTNKKYYKTINIPELDRCGLVPDQSNITINHQFNTLIVTYKKPQLLNEMEIEVLKVLQDVETEADVDDFLQELLDRSKK